jgi:hypothetical protein
MTRTPFLWREVNKVALNHILVGTIAMKTLSFHLTTYGVAASLVYASLRPSHQCVANHPYGRAVVLGAPSGPGPDALRNQVWSLRGAAGGLVVEPVVDLGGDLCHLLWLSQQNRRAEPPAHLQIYHPSSAPPVVMQGLGPLWAGPVPVDGPRRGGKTGNWKLNVFNVLQEVKTLFPAFKRK